MKTRIDENRDIFRVICDIKPVITEEDKVFPIRGPGVLRELCSDPALANLYDFAILPEYAEARWGGL